MSARPSRATAETTTPAIVEAEPSPADVVERLRLAVSRGELPARLASQAIVRLIPPARQIARVELPPVVDASSFAEASRAILQAAAEGRVAPGDGVQLLRAAKLTFAAVRAAERAGAK
jgi:hypothetical protein